MARTTIATSNRRIELPEPARERPSATGAAGFTWLVSGNVLYSACQWGIVWVLARLGSTEQVGHYALGMVVCGPVMLFANFQVRALIASDLREDYRLGQYLSFRFASLGTALAAIAGFALLSQTDAHVAWIIVAVGAAQAVDLISETYYGVMQREERLDRMSHSLLIKGPLALAALAAAMYFTRDVLFALLALTLGRLAVLLLWDSRLGFARGAIRAHLVWDRGKALSLLRLALPLGVIAMLVSFNANIPRYFVETYGGRSALGIFATIASLLSMGTLVVSAMGQSLFVPVAQACSRGDIAAYRRFVGRAAALGAALGAAGIAIAGVGGERVLDLLFGPEYSAHSRLLLFLTAAGTISFVASALGYIMTAARSLKAQVPLMATTAIAAMASSAWLVPAYGLEGAAAASGVAALVQLGGTLVILRAIDRSVQTHEPKPAALAFGAPGGTA